METQVFPELKNDAILKAAMGEKPHRIPIWIMRQAGRYLPEFRELRKSHDFFEIVNTPELAAEVTLQPIRRFDLDAAIIFSDILVVPTAVGMEVKMEPGVGPVLPSPINSPKDIDHLNFECDVKLEMKGTLAAITLTRKLLDGKVPLIGFCGAPWTLMSYMIEGGGSRTLSKSKCWLYKYPEDSKRFLSLICEVCIRYLVEQVRSGAQLLQIFESHADLLSPDLFNEFCIPMLSRIETKVRALLKAQKLPRVPMIVFAKGAHYAIKEISSLGFDVVGLDWTINPRVARQFAAPETVFQGNLDPCALYGDADSIKTNATRMMERMDTNYYICNLGHGIYPDTPVESVQALIDVVHATKVH